MSIQVEHYGQASGRKQVRAWLSRARWLDKEIDAKLEQIAQLRDKVKRCTGSLSAASSGGHKDWTDPVLSLDVLERQINADIDDLLNAKAQIREAIMQLPTDEMRLLMDLRYLNLLGWKKIAQRMHMDRSSCWRLHEVACENIRIPESCNTMQHSSC